MIDRRPADGVPEAGAGLGAIAFRIEEEAAVIVRVVFRPEARLPVAAVAGLNAAMLTRYDEPRELVLEHPTLPELDGSRASA